MGHNIVTVESTKVDCDSCGAEEISDIDVGYDEDWLPEGAAACGGHDPGGVRGGVHA